MPYPAETKVRIAVRHKVYESPGFEASASKISEDIVVGGEALGNIEIYCTRNCAYLKKQDNFTKTLAERIGGAVHSIELEQSLQGYYEQLEEMVEKRTRDLEQAQGQLRLLSDTVKSSIDGITLADLAGNITFANDASRRMWGYGAEELTNLKMAQLYSPGELGLVDREIIPGSKSGVWNGELTAVRRDGSHFPSWSLPPPSMMKRGDPRHRRRPPGHHRNKDMKDKLIRSERLAAVGELASGWGTSCVTP